MTSTENTPETTPEPADKRVAAEPESDIQEEDWRALHSVQTDDQTMTLLENTPETPSEPAETTVEAETESEVQIEVEQCPSATAGSGKARTVTLNEMKWRLAIARYQDLDEKDELDGLLRAGVPAPDFAREWLLGTLKRPGRGRPPKLKHPERVIRAVCYQIICGAGNSNSGAGNEAHRLVAEKYGVKPSAVTSVWKEAKRETPETIERIRAELLADIANPLFADAFAGVKKP